MTTSGTATCSSLERINNVICVTLTEPTIAPCGRHLFADDILHIDPEKEPTSESLVLLDGYVAPYTGQSGVVGVVTKVSRTID